MNKRTGLLLLLLSCFTQLYAGHELGGVIIRYESVAHVHNNPFQYVLSVYSIYDKQGVSSPANATVNLQSSCYGSTSFTLPKITTGGAGLLPLVGADYCSGTNFIQNNYGLALYRDTVVLPGLCSNYLFSIIAGSGRFNAMPNIATNYSQNYFETTLNNTMGPNSSPTIAMNQLIQAVCINRPLRLYGYSDTDGDSLFITKSTPLIVSGATQVPVSYASGYSQANQVNATGGYAINNATGEIQTTISAPSPYLLTCHYFEYRLDTNTNQKIIIGESRISTVIIASSACSPLPFELRYPVATHPDSLSCTASSVRIATSRKMSRSSVTTTGSEFEVISSKLGALAVQSAVFINDSTMELNLAQGPLLNDTLQVVALAGTDNNTVYSSCGQLLIAGGDTLLYFTPAQSTIQAGFTHTNNLLSVSFNASSSVNAIAYSWDFGDGSPLSVQPNPVHNYAAAGTYSVQLVVENACGVYDTLLMPVEVCEALAGDFSYNVTNNGVVFNANNTAGNALQFFWAFGDGNTGTGNSITYQYASGGTYWVSLTMVNACGDSLLYADSVEVCAPPHVEWTYTVVSTGVGGMTVDFDGSSAINTSSFSWSFGDGGTNTTSLTPRHVYATPSLNYLVSLKVYNDCGGVYERAFRLNQIGLEEKDGLKVSLYPNPSKGYFYLEVEEAVEIQVFNSLGATVYRGYIAESQHLQLPPLSAGVYCIAIKGERGSTLFKHFIE
jgi:PKD repeat protein